MSLRSISNRLPIAALAAASLLVVACAKQTQTEATATRAPGTEGAVSAQVNTDGDATATPVTIGWLTVPGTASENEPEPEPTKIEYEVDPLLASNCDAPKKTVYFEHDSDEVSDAAELAIAQVALCLEKAPLNDDHVEIIGHADETGAEEYNRELGLDRANSVAEALVSEGISKDRIATYSFGEYKADEPRNWDDRRVVIRLAK